MTERTHYVELGIQESATATEIRAAYRRLVLLYHPDRSGDKGTTERFVRISEAYRTLSDESLRTEYDGGLKYRRDREIQRTAEQSAPSAPRTSTVSQSAKQAGQRTIGDEAAKVQQAAAMFATGKYDY